MYDNAVRLSGGFSNVSAQCTYEFDDEENNTSNKKVIRISVSFNSFGIISICLISWYPLLPRTSIRVYTEEAVVVSFFLKRAFLHMT